MGARRAKRLPPRELGQGGYSKPGRGLFTTYIAANPEEHRRDFNLPSSAVAQNRPGPPTSQVLFKSYIY